MTSLPTRGAPSFDEPFATEIFNTYFWPMMWHTNMRRFLNPNSKSVEHQGFLAVFLDETNMGLQGDGWQRFLMSSANPATASSPECSPMSRLRATQ
jgi:hypothetical protein